MKKLIFNLIIILILFSCEKDVTFNFKHEPKLNLNCILNPDSLVTAKLTLSQSIDNPDKIKQVNGAIITLFEGDVLFGVLKEESSGQYKLEKKPKEGKTYKITADVEGYALVSAETTIPYRPEIEYEIEINKHTENNKFYDMHVNLYDKPGRDFYWIYKSWVVNNRHYASGVNVINSPYTDNFNQIIDSDLQFGYYLFLGVHLTDEGYDGQTLKFSIPDLNLTQSEVTYSKGLYFMNADEHHHKYIKTFIINRFNETSELPFYEPVQIYSNIKNGFGIFGSNAVTTIDLRTVI